MSARLPGLQLRVVIKVGGCILLAEEQPVFPFCTPRLALFEERTKRCDACTGANHDQRYIIVIRQAEMPGRLGEDRHLRSLPPVSEEA
ncbi:hypothetical protein D3C79_886210 [compost metagenome]